MIPLETDKCAMRNHRLTSAVWLTSLFLEAKVGGKKKNGKRFWQKAGMKLFFLPGLPKAVVWRRRSGGVPCIWRDERAVKCTRWGKTLYFFISLFAKHQSLAPPPRKQRPNAWGHPIDLTLSSSKWIWGERSLSYINTFYSWPWPGRTRDEWWQTASLIRINI